VVQQCGSPLDGSLMRRVLFKHLKTIPFTFEDCSIFNMPLTAKTSNSDLPSIGFCIDWLIGSK
jgi:hypothetical protein